jgi:predicted PurR-regulated permease PerM
MQSTADLDARLKKTLLVIGYMIIIAGAVYALAQLRPVVRMIANILAPFCVALIVAYIFNPIVTFVQQRLRLSRIMGLVVFYIIIVLLIAIFMLFLLPSLYHQISELIKRLSEIIPAQLDTLMRKYNITLGEKQRQNIQGALESLGTDLQGVFAAMLPGLQAAAKEGVSVAGALAKGVAAGFGFFFSFVSFLIFVIIINFYFLLDFHKIKGLISTAIPSQHEERVFSILKKIDVAVGGFLRGQLIICCLVGTLTTIGLLLIGLRKYAILIGVVAGVGNIIPYLGPLLGAVSSLIRVLASSAFPGFSDKLVGAAEVITLFALIQAIDGVVFQPRIVGKNSELHPLAVMLALMVGANFGLVGMIVAVPVASIVRILIKEFWWDKLSEAKRRGVLLNAPRKT